MKLINREIDALISKMTEDLREKRKQEIESFKKLPNVQKLALKLSGEYNKLSLDMKKAMFWMFTLTNGKLAKPNMDYWIERAICNLKIKATTPNSLPGNTRRDIILASADSNTIEEVLVKLKLKK